MPLEAVSEGGFSSADRMPRNSRWVSYEAYADSLLMFMDAVDRGLQGKELEDVLNRHARDTQIILRSVDASATMPRADGRGGHPRHRAMRDYLEVHLEMLRQYSQTGELPSEIKAKVGVLAFLYLKYAQDARTIGISSRNELKTGIMRFDRRYGNGTAADAAYDL